MGVVLPEGRVWPNTPSGGECRIEVFGATGEYQSGKTLLGLSIAPGCHPEGHKFAGKPRTLILDFEKSPGTYGGTGCERIDVPMVVTEKMKGQAYTPHDVFTWFLAKINNVEPGQYDVIMADPITDIESGLVDYVKRNGAKFSLTANQISKGGGLVWGAVKDYWKQVLLMLGTRCQTFFFTSHLRTIWKGNIPTGEKEPKGKDTLLELTSLYLWLEREAGKDGKVAGVPAARVLKNRLSDTLISDGGQLEITQLLPPRLPEASVQAIREYIANPPNYNRLKAAEKVKMAPEASEAEKLQLRIAAAEAERDAEESALKRMVKTAELRAAPKSDSPPPNPDETARIQQSKAAKAKADAVRARMKADEEELAKLEKEGPETEARAKAETERLMATSDATANTTAAKAAGSVVQEEPAEEPTAEPPFEAEEPAKDYGPDACTRQQQKVATDLLDLLGMSDDDRKAMYAKVNASELAEISWADCLKLISFLTQKVNKQKK